MNDLGQPTIPASAPDATECLCWCCALGQAYCNHCLGPSSNLLFPLGTFRQHTHTPPMQKLLPLTTLWCHWWCNMLGFFLSPLLRGPWGQGLCLLCHMSSGIIREQTLDKCLLDKLLNEQSNVSVYINTAFISILTRAWLCMYGIQFPNDEATSWLSKPPKRRCHTAKRRLKPKVQKQTS